MSPFNPHHAQFTAAQQAALDWHTRRQRPEWSLDDEQALTDWLLADDSHCEAFASYQDCEQTLASLPMDAIAQIRGNLAIDKARQGAAPPKRVLPTNTSPISGQHHRWAIAACLCLLGGWVGIWHHQYASPVFAQSYSTAKGELMEVTLPDGTHLHMDTESEIQVRYYRGQREVLLKGGQAMFAVYRDPNRPFLVTADKTRVTVLGTRFAVRYTPEQQGRDQVQVAVEEGQVRVSTTPSLLTQWLPLPYITPSGTDMTAGQQLTALADGDPGAIRKLDVESIAPWRTHQLSFVNMPLAQAIDELNRYTDTGLVIHDPRVAELRISGTFDPRHMETMKRILPQALPVHLEKKGHMMEITSAPEK